MRSSSQLKNHFNTESNPVFFSLAREILSNGLGNMPSYQSWQSFFARYIDPEVIHRKKDIKEFERKFDSDFFEILFSIHLLVYLIGKKFVQSKKIPINVRQGLYENLFEETITKLSSSTRVLVDEKISNELEVLLKTKTSSAYDLFEIIYRSISPREIRKPLGEYFTPLVLAERMVSEVDYKFINDRWMDNSSGFGVFLLAYIKRFGIEKISNFTCIETNPLSVFITKVIILCEYAASIKNIDSLPIYWGDALLNQKYSYDNGKIVVVGNFNNYYNKIGVIVGNPPWVSWKSMTKDYQALIGDDWRSYDIFEKNITRKTMGACNDDISSYFVYFSIDKFIKTEGMLKFVINLSLFKSNLVGKQFRQFNIKKSNTPFKITKIQDLSNYKVFQGITNTYCIFDAVKGERTVYPVEYHVLSGTNTGDEKIIVTTARPVNDKDGGALITVNGRSKHFNSIEGLCEYKARAGVCTWLNSVYWVRKIEEGGDTIRIINLGTSGKRKLKEIETEVEKDLVFRLLRARNLKDFDPIIENSIVVPQQINNLSKPIPEELMKERYKKAFDFFSNFREELVERSGYKKFLDGQPFYGLYNIGPYTTAPIKLGWQFVSKKFQVFLIDNAEDIIPDLNVMFIPLENLDEAYYLHALLNSKYASEKIESSTNWTFPSGSIQKVYLEKYNSEDKLHTRISSLQKDFLTNKNDRDKDEIDELFKEYWFNGRRKKLSAGDAQLSLV